MFHNVVIGKPLVEPWVLLANDKKDWIETEEKHTLFIIMVRLTAETDLEEVFVLRK